MGYKVQKGDGWYKIAKNTGMDVNELLKLNNATLNTVIHPGQEIKTKAQNDQSGLGKYVQGFAKEETPKTMPTPYKLGYTEQQFIKDNARSIQQQLANAGYDLGKYGVDGKWGKASQAALDAARRDGYTLNGDVLVKPAAPQQPALKPRLGAQPKAAQNPLVPETPVSETYIPWTPTIKPGQRCGVEGCAKYANDSLIRHKDAQGRTLYTPDEVGGHAWTRLSAGKNTKMVYSGYGDTPYDKNAYSPQASDKRNFDAADRLYREFDSKTLDKNKVYMVNMFYKESPSREQAWREASNGTTGTHTGNLYYDTKTNRWRVSHNIHGTVYDDDFIAIQGSRGKWGVTAIAEPYHVDYTERDRAAKKRNGGYLIKKHNTGGPAQKTRIKGGYVNSDGSVDIDPVSVTGFYQPKERVGLQGQQFIKGINDARQYMMENHNWSDEDFANFGRVAINLASQESDFGRGKRYMVKLAAPDYSIQTVKAIRGAYNWATGEGEFPTTVSAPSKGLTQIKFRDDIDDPVLREKYHDANLYSEEQLVLPKQSALTTLIRLDHNDKKLKGGTYVYSNGDSIPWDEQHAFMWNAGRLTSEEQRAKQKEPIPRNDDPALTRNPEGYSKYVKRYLNNSIYKFPRKANPESLTTPGPGLPRP